MMQEFLSNQLSLDSYNGYSDAFWMKLTGNLANPETLTLYLTLNFDEQWLSLLNGRIKFGLKGGELQLQLENSHLTAASEGLGSFFCVTTTDSQTHPTWQFTINPPDAVLKGLVEKAQLGTFQVTGYPSRITATFGVSPSHIYLTDAEGLWLHDVNPNQHAILTTKLVHFLCETEFKPYISWAQIGVKCPTISPSLPQKDEKAIASDSQQLQSLIGEITQAKTADFLSLASLAGLDPKQDFAGANLLGAILDNLDFSGANLSSANLRGAELNDTDLSGANLSRVNLRGADLSGAYLSNADLSFSDCSKSSLALANLSEANLQGANLEEVNLTNTNLSGANVEGAIFSTNAGLSEEMKQNLTERGAVIN
ncbi:MAG: pentapeptide repeat-containing protein [Chroococcales cyanobacterium]